MDCNGSMGGKGGWGFEPLGILFGLVNLEMAEGVDKVLNAGELAIDGGKAHVGNFVFVAEGGEDEVTDCGAGGFAAAALLKLAFKIINDRFEAIVGHAGFFAGSHNAPQELRVVKEFPMAIPFNHCDRDEFDPFVGGETVLAIHTFSPSSNAFLAVGGAGFEDTAFSVLAVGTLHGAWGIPDLEHTQPQ